MKNYTESSGSYKFLHKDYLGSILAITDEAGSIVEENHFDAWGQLTKGTTALLGRGYTGHEHFAEVGIIHMNGRLYDPLLRRFINPDPFIQDGTNTQNYNKYAYVLNNPLIFFDPTGYVSEILLENIFHDSRSGDVWHNSDGYFVSDRTGRAIDYDGNFLNNYGSGGNFGSGGGSYKYIDIPGQTIYAKGKKTSWNGGLFGQYNLEQMRYAIEAVRYMWNTNVYQSMGSATGEIKRQMDTNSAEWAMTNPSGQLAYTTAVAFQEAPFVIGGEYAVMKVGKYLMAAKGVTTELSVAEQAANLSKRINKNSFMVGDLGDGMKMQYDFLGATHRGVPTPHVQLWKLNINPVTGVENYNKVSKFVIPMTQKHINYLNNYFNLMGL